MTLKYTRSPANESRYFPKIFKKIRATRTPAESVVVDNGYDTEKIVIHSADSTPRR